MRRREFITLLGGATAWPLAAYAQQVAMPVIGFLNSGTAEGFAAELAAFREGLNDIGYIEGQNVGIEYRWAEGHYGRLVAMAADLVQMRVSVIYTAGGALPAQAAAAATTTIPIVFGIGGDPVKSGLVTSMNRPERNLTGMTFLSDVLGAKRVDVLLGLINQARKIALLVNPKGATSAAEKIDVETAVRSRGLELRVVEASTDDAIDAAFAALAQDSPDALCVTTDPVFTSNRDHIVELVARHRVPTVYPLRMFVAAGGLASYGTNIDKLTRQEGVYVGRILRGAKPADPPVLQPTTFELVINLKTAKALGLNVPPMLLALADEVIE